MELNERFEAILPVFDPAKGLGGARQPMADVIVGEYVKPAVCHLATIYQITASAYHIIILNKETT